MFDWENIDSDLYDQREYYHVAQGLGGIIPTNALPNGITGIGTDGCGTCLGFYIQLDENRKYAVEGIFP